MQVKVDKLRINKFRGLNDWESPYTISKASFSEFTNCIANQTSIYSISSLYKHNAIIESPVLSIKRFFANNVLTYIVITRNFVYTTTNFSSYNKRLTFNLKETFTPQIVEEPFENIVIFNSYTNKKLYSVKQNLEVNIYTVNLKLNNSSGNDIVLSYASCLSETAQGIIYGGVEYTEEGGLLERKPREILSTFRFGGNKYFFRETFKTSILALCKSSNNVLVTTLNNFYNLTRIDLDGNGIQYSVTNQSSDVNFSSTDNFHKILGIGFSASFFDNDNIGGASDYEIIGYITYLPRKIRDLIIWNNETNSVISIPDKDIENNFMYLTCGGDKNQKKFFGISLNEGNAFNFLDIANSTGAGIMSANSLNITQLGFGIRNEESENYIYSPYGNGEELEFERIITTQVIQIEPSSVYTSISSITLSGRIDNNYIKIEILENDVSVSEYVYKDVKEPITSFRIRHIGNNTKFRMTFTSYFVINEIIIYYNNNQ
jgi:hypothetical protein